MKLRNKEAEKTLLGCYNPLIKMASTFNVEFQLRLCSTNGLMRLKSTLTIKELEVLLLALNRTDKILGQ